MKKIAFIIPFFGKFNNYFQLFLNSCEANEEYDWLIFTDDKTKYKYPKNVHVSYWSFEQLVEFIQSKFEFKIGLNKPYKLCDFKPAYGYIFEEYITEYKCWGHCDVDLIFGNISNFISLEDLDIYDKIGILGHCTIYKNNPNINRAFKSQINGEERYKTVYMNTQNFSFDEEFNLSINNIFENQGYRIRYEEEEANIYTKSSDFRITRMDLKRKAYEVEPRSRSFFIWNKGRLVRYKKNKIWTEEEFLYIHLQSRPMKIEPEVLELDYYKIIPNSFEKLECKLDEQVLLDKIKCKHFNLHYFKLRASNLYKKIKKHIKRMDNKKI